MARDSKGQQVKTFQHPVPGANGAAKLDIIKVYFQAASGAFVIFLPPHIADVGSSLVKDKEDRRPARLNYAEIRGDTLDGTIEYFKTILTRYLDFVREQIREKMIRVTYKSNLRWADSTREHCEAYRRRLRPGGDHEISFCGNPALHLHFEVVWRVNNQLFRETSEGTLTRIGDRDEFCIPWTAEREAFFTAMRDRLEQLIMKIDVFTAALRENPDLAIAHAGGMLALEGPKR